MVRTEGVALWATLGSVMSAVGRGGVGLFVCRWDHLAGEGSKGQTHL